MRRPLVALALCSALAAALMVGSFPLSTWLHQRAALAAATQQLARLRASNAQMAASAKLLQAPAAIESLARQEYGLVPQGSEAFAILPSAQLPRTPLASAGSLAGATDTQGIVPATTTTTTTTLPGPSLSPKAAAASRVAAGRRAAARAATVKRVGTTTTTTRPLTTTTTTTTTAARPTTTTTAARPTTTTARPTTTTTGARPTTTTTTRPGA